MKEKIKRLSLVILANPLSLFGGGERWVLEAVTRLKKDFDITVVNQVSDKDVIRLPKREMAERYNLKGVNILDLECVGVGTVSVGAGPFILRTPKFRDLINLKRAIEATDVVYAVSFNPIILFLGLLFSKLHGKRFIVGLHNPSFLNEAQRGYPLYKRMLVRLNNTIQRGLLTFVDDVHVQTETQRRALVRANYHGNIFYIPHYLYLKPGKKKISKENEFVVLFVGRFAAYQKGIDLLREIVEKTINKNSEIRFHMIGSGDSKGERIVSHLEKVYKNNVRWFGFVSDRKLKSEYLSASLFVLPSRYETPGLSLLEAQGYGLPAVAFDVPGPRDIMNDPVQGRLVQAFDTDKFSDSIIEYYKLYNKNLAGYREVCDRVRRSVIGRYSEDLFVDRFVRMIESVPGRRLLLRP